MKLVIVIICGIRTARVDCNVQDWIQLGANEMQCNAESWREKEERKEGEEKR